MASVFWLRYRYWILSLAIIALVLPQTIKGMWGGDFWEHAAVVRELAANPWDPQHPILQLDAPHAFYSPYALVVALGSNLTGIHPVNALALGGIFNLTLLLFGIYWFVSIFSRKTRNATAFYTLLLILFFVSPYLPRYSGFFQLNNLGRVIPYPSTFAFALSMITLAIHHRRLATGRDAWIALEIIFASVVLITHPFSFIFLGAGMAAISFTRREGLFVEMVKLGGIFALTFLIAALWPYYPFLDLVLGGDSVVYHATNRIMYDQILLRNMPVFLGIPLLIFELRRDTHSPLAWMYIFLMVVFILGGLSGAYSYGRVLFGLALVVYVMIAKYLAGFEAKLAAGSQSGRKQPVIFSLVVTSILVALTFFPTTLPLIQGIKNAERNQYKDYTFLAKYTKPEDMVLADYKHDVFVPVFGGKLVSYSRPLAFIDDQRERQKAVEKFFSESSSRADRKAVIDDYLVDYVLLDIRKTPHWNKRAAELKDFGNAFYKGDRFYLFEIDHTR
jgi:alpha-1,6-mannosyltransferase